MRREAILVAGVILLVPTLARADDGWRWDVGAKTSYVVIGEGAHRTGGVMPALSVRLGHSLAPAVEAWVGAEVGAFGFGGAGARWIGALGGPSIGVAFTPLRLPLEISAALVVDMGRIPVCNGWGLCLRYVGIYPAAVLGAVINLGPIAQLGGELEARYIKTMAWEGASWEPAVVGRVRF